MEDNKKKSIANRIYTKHGQRRCQGQLVKVHGVHALGYFDGDKIVGYTTLEEIQEMSCLQELEELQLDF